jgi:hypothetical protein
MKFRLFALILTLSLVVWAQEPPTGSVAPNSTPAPQAEGCCHHMAGAKDGKNCCHHAAVDAKEATACCGKDKCEMKTGKSCCRDKEMKACMKLCKKNGNCPAGKDCCGAGASDKTAASCCGDKCERHQHSPAAS